MFKTIDDIMYITDGNNPFRENILYGRGSFINQISSFKTADGLGYVPTPYNMVGGTINNNIEYGKYHLIFKNKIIDGISASIPKDFNQNITNSITPNFTKNKKVFTIRLKKNPDKIILSIIEGTLKNIDGKVILIEDKNQYFTTLYFKDENDVNIKNIMLLINKFKKREIPILGMNDANLFLSNNDNNNDNNNDENNEIKHTIERVIELREELKNKGLNKGFWVLADDKDFKPLKDKDDNIIVRLNKLKTDILDIDDKKYKVNVNFKNKKFAFINFGFDNDFLKLSPDEIKKNYSKYSNHLVCSLSISIEVITDEGQIGKRNWECIINFTLDDLIHYNLKYKDAEYFMRNTADKLVLSNNMIGVSYKNYKIALDKELKKNIKDKEDNNEKNDENNKIKDTIKRVIELREELKNKGLNKGFWVLADDKDFKPLKDKDDNIIIRFNKLKTDFLGINEKEYYVKENKFKNKKLAFINQSFDVDFLRLPIEDIKKNYDEYKNHLVIKLAIAITPIEKDGKIGRFHYECRINFTLDDLIHYNLKFKDVEYFMRNTADKLVLSNNMIGVSYKNYKVALDKELKKNIKDKEDNNNIMKKTYKESNIMKARSDLKKKGDKYTVDTEMNVKEGLDGKTKRALKKSIEDEVKKKIKGFKKPVGFGVEKIVLDYSSSEDEKPKKRGRPKKGKGLEESESSSDEDDIKEYGKILKHLIGHIKDPKEKIDKNDFKQAIELIKKIKSKKGEGVVQGSTEGLERMRRTLENISDRAHSRVRDFTQEQERARQNADEIIRKKEERIENKRMARRGRIAPVPATIGNIEPISSEYVSIVPNSNGRGIIKRGRPKKK